MNSALDLLNKASERLSKMTSEEAIRRTKDLGITIPTEPPLKKLIDHFIFDLDGMFKDVLNSRTVRSAFNKIDVFGTVISCFDVNGVAWFGWGIVSYCVGDCFPVE